jgi:hypothetical protein
MKKQINPTIKAHLLRSALYLLLLVAVCAIPFALAQRNATKRAVAKSAAKPNAGFYPTAAGAQAVPPAAGAAQTQQSIPTVCSYNFTTGTGTFVPGTTNIGIDCDDCGVTIPLPFPVTLYDQTFTSATAGSNGHLTFGTAYNGFGITCMPETTPTYAIGPFWVDQYPVSITCPTCGVFTTTTGVSPNRIFYVEWRTAYYPGNPTPTLDYEVILYETPPSPGAFDVAYQLVTDHPGGTDSALTVGVQQNTTNFTEVGCDPTGTNPPPSVVSGAYFIWTLVPCASPTPTPTATPTPTGTPGGCQFRVLIAYADIGGLPTMIQNEILAEPGVIAVDLFDAFSGTPTLQQLQQYNIVYAFSNNFWADPVGMGNVLADYEDGGGVVVVGTFAWDNRGGWNLAGRWMTGGYSPFNSTNITNFSFNTANITNPGHPLMQGVNSLSAFYRNGVTLAAGASSTAVWTDGPPAVAYQTNNGHTAVGINAYLGYLNQFSGEWGRLIVNAGRWLLNCQGVSPTPTATPTASPTCTPGGAKIYNIAGFGLGFQTNTTRIYDIASNTWSTGAPIPEGNGLSDAATAYWNGKIYVAAGYNGAATNTLHIYDIASNSWTTGAPLPQALFLPGFGAINGKVYVASGNSGSVELNTLYIYDIATNTWTTGANVPTPVTGPGSAVYQGKLYLFGGGFPTPLTVTQIYDPVANSWTSGPSLNFARLWFYGGAIDDTSIVAPGGDNPPGIPLNVNEQLTASWAIRAPLPYNARGPFAVSDGTFVYIGGGYDGSSVHTDTLRYDPVANTYTPLAPAPDQHYLSQAVLVPNQCGTPTPTPTATFTPTPTPSATFTPTPTPSATFTPTPTPTPVQITLHARGYKVHGLQTVDLFWSGPTSGAIDIYRNGVLIITVPNDGGAYTDHINRNGRGTYTYRVCIAGTGNCSNEVTVRFGSG